MPGKSLRVAASLSILVILIVVAFFTIQHLNRPDKLVEAFEAAVEQNKPEWLTDLILPDQKEAVVNKGTLGALVAYLRANDHSYHAIKDGLYEQIEAKDYSSKNQQISIIRDGKKWGILTDYKLKVKTTSIKVSGQNENDQVQLSIKAVKKPLKISDEHVYGPILPGSHDVSVTIHNSLGTLTEKKQVDAWGNDLITYVVDTERLAKGDQGITNEIIEAVEILNRDLSAFETSAYNTNVFTNVNDDFKGGEYTQELIDSAFSFYAEYIDEIQSQYLGAVVNLDQLRIDYFDGHWSANVKALVTYNRKIKIADVPTYEDLSYQSIRTYALVYHEKEKKWLIDRLTDTEATGSEQEYWKKKKTLTVKNPPLLKWSRTDSENQLTSL
ncbi:TcaA second domain-containing protein [Bacillus tuaregi]|uniref:TcaA second domain-containing protein n=1 Tax=Bacillus tuaregi TaxID=1816695 RepID=UPI000A01D756|nr:hypothetical protein [Bacillus tuaregi]